MKETFSSDVGCSNKEKIESMVVLIVNPQTKSANGADRLVCFMGKKWQKIRLDEREESFTFVYRRNKYTTKTMLSLSVIFPLPVMFFLLQKLYSPAM